MRFRPTNVKDMPHIREINSFDFKLTPGEMSIVDGVIVDEDGDIVSFGIVKPMAEATFLTNPKFSKRARVEAMDIMLKIAFERSREFGVKQLHVFCDDVRLARMLTKHYDFLNDNSIVLVKNL